MASEWFALDGSASVGRSYYDMSYSRLCLEGDHHALDEVASVLSDSPLTAVLVHVLYLNLVWYLDLILPTEFFYMFLIKMWYYGFRLRILASMDTSSSIHQIFLYNCLDIPYLFKFWSFYYVLQ
ncbi:hypothetical protein NL676_028786 [Syzygium grande]|nr:hypothetical protein NL676_028786 [Syzygium grande]